MDIKYLRRLNSPWVVAFLVGILFASVLFIRLRRVHFDVSRLVVAGDRFCDPAQVPLGLFVFRGSPGYDGQFYYRLALNPFTHARTDFGITLDTPNYRQQRVFFSLLAWVVSLGQPRLVPMAMLAINFAALIALGWMGAALAQSFNLSAFWGIFVALQPAYYYILTRDLVEILEIALILGSLLLLRKGRSGFATMALTLAVMTRETALLVAIAAFLAYIVQRWKGGDGIVVRWPYFAVPILAFLSWQLVLRYNWGASPQGAASSAMIGFPFFAPWQLLVQSSQFRDLPQARTFLQVLFLAVFAVGVVSHVPTTVAPRLVIFSCLLYGALAVSLNQEIWVEDWAFFRATSQFCALGTIVLIGSRWITKVVFLGASALLWLLFSPLLPERFCLDIFRW
ncbi:MAG: AZOBR_p60025 family cell surface glycopolymer formation protein [Chthoniobacterales bacterium]